MFVFVYVHLAACDPVARTALIVQRDVLLCVFTGCPCVVLSLTFVFHVCTFASSSLVCMCASQVKSVTGSKILRVLKRNGLGPSLPEDLYHLIKKAVNVRKHLERNRKDKDSKFRLILIESRIHRLARYYKRARQLPPNWKYESATASALVA